MGQNCSSLLTQECLGLSDPRYDPNASNDLIDQDVLWKQYAGFWGPFAERRNVVLSDNNTPRQPSFYNPAQKVGWPYQSDAFTSYRRVTIVGTRFKKENFYFYKPASEEFCSQTPPDGMRNTVDPTKVCGEHGNVQIIEEFGTSTYEKDGTINLIWVNAGPESDESSGIPSQETRMSTVDGNAVFTYVNQPGVFTYTITETFYGEEDDYLIGVGTGASSEPSAPNFSRQSGSLSGPRIVDEDSFFVALQKAYDEHKVPTPDWVKEGQAIPGCLSEPWGSCPTEEDWCKELDPSCTESIYQEPAASLNGFGIALTTIFVVGFVSLGVHILKKYLFKSQQRRYKVHFAKIIADRIGHVGHLAQLDPKEMEEEFKRIDIGLNANDGMIQKDELWAWVQSGKAGTMTKKDFDALFQSLDIDGDGEVSFIEFCGFMARCGSEYDKEVEALLAKPVKAEQIRGITKMVSMKKVD